MLQVMMIVPKEENGVHSKVYRRVGLGQIYLKQWITVEPVFESIVLV
jgi:hypothetical protein